MKASFFYKSYLNGFNEIYNFKRNDRQTNCKAALKILSYATLIIPLTFAIVRCISSLCGRVKHKKEINSQDRKIKSIITNQNKSEQTLPKIEPKSNPDIQTQKQIEEAEALRFSFLRVGALCKIAKQQIEDKNLKAASHTLDKARKAIKPNEEAKDISSFCEIAEVRLMITPDKIPAELEEALLIEKNSRSNIPHENYDLLEKHIRKLCRLAETYHLAGKTDKAKELIFAAINCTNKNIDPLVFVSDLEDIATTQIKLGLIEEALLLLETAITNVSRIMDPEPQICKYMQICDCMTENSMMYNIHLAEERISRGLEILKLANNVAGKVINSKGEETPTFYIRVMKDLEKKNKDLLLTKEITISKIRKTKSQDLCKKARKQIEEQQIEAASATLDEANKMLALSDAKEILILCKIAKIRLIISPNKIPPELDDALSYSRSERSEIIPDRTHLLSDHVKILCKLAILYHLIGIDKARELILEATDLITWIKSNFEKITNLIRIAQTQLQINLTDEGIKSLEKLLKNIEDLNDCEDQVTLFVQISDMIISLKEKQENIPVNYAKKAIEMAEKALSPYINKSPSECEWLPENKETLEKAKEKLKKALERKDI